MKSRYYLIAIWALLCLSCSKEFLNDCDQESPAFKKVNADFTSSINNNTVAFKNNSLHAESYAWEFGDGTTSTVFDPNKTFAYRDTPYTVKLTASRCGGERQSVISKSIVIKCITQAPVIEVDKNTICSGEFATLKLKSPCASGSSVKWSTGATTNTITVSAAGKYTAQCVASCPSASSNEIQVAVNPKPNQPSVSGSNFDVCEGSSFSLPNSTCNIGTLTWNDGTTGLSKTPSTTTSYTVSCNSNNCISIPSKMFTLIVEPSKAAVSTMDGSDINTNFTLRGSIDFNTNNSIEDHGFIFKTISTTTPFKIGDSGVSKPISLGSKQKSQVNTFSILLNNPPNEISYIAYIKDCSGYKYGTIKKL